MLASDLPAFWEGLASAAGMAYGDLRERYQAQVREALWTGKMSEDAFWAWVEQCCPSLSRAQGRRLLQEALVPLPALGLLPEWSRYADLHILSNHRAEWLLPLLEPVKGHLAGVTVSSETGFRKPEPGIYERAARLLKPGFPILFVDDQERNLAEASRLGWETLLADENGAWMGQVGAWLRRDEA
ncbi:HAD-IA family hydrolase [Paenibacillus sp. CC-CFT747]|nr:HAD-IA family hydrolase [Paenibacillus sp. CC-CFT747]